MGCSGYSARGTRHAKFRNLTPYVPGSTKQRGAGPNTGTLGDVGAYANFVTPPGNPDQSSSSFVIWEPLDSSDLLEMSFYMVMSNGSSADNLTGEARIWLAREYVHNPNIPGYMGAFALDLNLTCGSKAVATTGSQAFPPNAYWVDTIAVALDATEEPQSVLAEDTSISASYANGCARIRFGKSGAQYLIAQLIGDNGTPSTRVGAVVWSI